MARRSFADVAKSSARQPTGRTTRRTNEGERWEEQNQRRTFYVNNELFGQLKKLRDQSGESLSSLVNEAIEGLLNRRL